ncbi:hypothetical protein SAMD00019534_013270 [Acytostelium subglobosum LB1]|uniref:hypothetical protein n=1 Tax=Acytostelium subglobosum LB1 TaxID=1410327 RepID=UPI000644AD45|nr:hypothetical protein SAMD00019534_013270 [Acytostelium subglobosum LB1]GAM18152.1 hypothetical protein SAMD00019534_013270 [Acytostelium subglobosum LB1]|eukprot:XP_012758748.1 hypothetical protein SAMD00019534_013270 [Acytostelium subglobosum LB1]
MTLICKRLFDHRQSYLHFNDNNNDIDNDNNMPLYNDYDINKVTLNSYKKIINNDFNNGPKTILIYTDEHYDVTSLPCDHRFFMSSDDDYLWKQEVLAMPFIKSISFNDCPDRPMDKKFWDNIVDLLQSLLIREPSPEIHFYQMANGPLPIRHVPITSLSLNDNDLDEVMVDTDMFPETLTNLNLYKEQLVTGNIDLTYLQSLKSLYFKWKQYNNDQALLLDRTVLPPSLTELRLDTELPSLKLDLPPSVTELYLYGDSEYHFGDSDDDICDLPFRRLCLHPDFNSHSSVMNAPGTRFPHLHKLVLLSFDDSVLSHITSNRFPVLEYLKLGLQSQESDDEQTALDLSSLPSSIKSLEITPRRSISLLPAGIECLNLKSVEVFQMLSTIDWHSPSPSLIKTLTLDSYGHELKVGDIPSSVTSLRLINFIQPLSNVLLALPGIRKLLWYSGLKSHVIELLQQLPTTIQQLKLMMYNEAYDEQKFNLRRISPTTFIRIDDQLVRSGFIDLESFQSLIERTVTD